MQKTSIEWVRNPDGSQGYTFNPITGCLNNCPYCYARKLANGRLKQRYLANHNVADTSQRLRDPNSSLWDRVVTDPFYPRFWPERLKKPYNPIMPVGIFVCNMGELFGDWIPQNWQEQIFEVIKGRPQHRFYLLTKQPQNLVKFSPFPDNCWVGVTATGLQMFNKAMFNLQQIEAEVKYISLEPLLEEIPMSSSWLTLLGQPIIQWVIIGAQTKPTIYPKIEWVQEIVEVADKAGISVFLKDNLGNLLFVKERLAFRTFDDRFMLEKLRQEFPK